MGARQFVQNPNIWSSEKPTVLVHQPVIAEQPAGGVAHQHVAARTRPRASAASPNTRCGQTIAEPEQAIRIACSATTFAGAVLQHAAGC